jgi:hypothetical protein
MAEEFPQRAATAWPSMQLTQAPPPNKSAEKVSKKIVVVPATSTSRKKRVRILEPGSNAWVAACSAKYASFDSGTGNYKSMNGKLKRCNV